MNDVDEVVDQKIKLGEEEFSQDQLQKYVSLGKLAEEAETKYNTKIDRVWPEYSRAQNELKQLREEKQTWETKAKPELDEDQEQVVRRAKDNAKKIGIVTDENFDELMDKKFQERYQSQRSAEKLLDNMKDLEKNIDGKDGRPKFELQDVIGFMQEKGVSDPELAYKWKYEKELDAWKEEQFSKTRKGGYTTLSSSTAGAKMPPSVKVTRDNLNQLVAEAMNTN